MSDTRDRDQVRIGDSDPEDAWDDGDTLEAKLAILERVVTALHRHPDQQRRAEAIRLVAKLRYERAEIEARINTVHDALREM